MNKTQEIKVNGVRQENDAWHRYIYFNREGQDYELTLYWDQFTGYEIMWRSNNGKAPEWASDWDEEAHNGMTLEHYLDDLTYEMENK